MLFMLCTSHKVSPWHKVPVCSGASFSKVPKTFRVRKALSKTLTHLFCEASLFICCKGNKNKNNYKVSCFETPLFHRYKENYVTQNAPEKFRDFRETSSRTEPSGLNAINPRVNKSYTFIYKYTYIQFDQAANGVTESFL